MLIELTPGCALDIDPLERTLHEPQWATVAEYIVARLCQIRPGRPVRVVRKGESVDLRAVVATESARGRRLVGNFAEELRDAAEVLMLDLHQQILPMSGAFALEIRYSDGYDNTGNEWREFFFLHARLLRVAEGS